MSKKQIAVLERGFVYVGDCEVEDGFLVISNASCVRRWGTTKGLGELAMKGPLENTDLDPTPTVRVPLGGGVLIHLIDCEAGPWTA